MKKVHLFVLMEVRILSQAKSQCPQFSERKKTLKDWIPLDKIYVFHNVNSAKSIKSVPHPNYF